MKAIISILTYLIFSVMTHAQTPADDAQIKSLVKFMDEGWNKKDGNLFAKPFAQDADYVVINGMFIKGKPAIAGGHQGIFDNIYKETSLKTEVRSIRYLRPDIAIAHVDARLTGKSAGKEIDNKATMTLTLEKTSAGWQIDAFQNTSVEQVNR